MRMKWRLKRLQNFLSFLKRYISEFDCCLYSNFFWNGFDMMEMLSLGVGKETTVFSLINAHSLLNAPLQ